MAIQQWYIGCSGFHYREWRGKFYPEKLPASKWFSYYTTQFNTLEINSSFYRFPSLRLLQNWFAQAPEDFRFSIKVPRFITHFRRFLETERMLRDFYDLLEESIKPKLGCVLFQLPPQSSYNKDLLERIMAQADPSFQNVVEFRHESWWRKQVFSRLKKEKIVFSGVSFPGIPQDEALVQPPLAYYRFHGVPRLFYSPYKKTFLENVAAQLDAATNVHTAYVYFNNTASLAALRNAAALKKIVNASR